jgi:hypothetical protein
MLLPIKSVRDSLNLDRFDKAFVWAALLLRQNTLSSLNPANALKTENPYKDNVLIAHDLYETVSGVKTAVLKVQVKLLYDSQGFLGGGGNLINYIKELTDSFNTLSINPFYEATTKTITAEPVNITSVEKFVYWCALNLLNANYLNNKNISITLNEKNYPNNYIQIDASLPLIINNFLSGLSYVDCLDKPVNISIPALAAPLVSGTTLTDTKLIDALLASFDSSSSVELSKDNNNLLLVKNKKSSIYQILRMILTTSISSGVSLVADDTNSTIKLSVDSEAIFQLVMSFLVESTGIDLIINDVTNRISIAAEAQQAIDYYLLLKGILINGNNTPLSFNDSAKKITVNSSANATVDVYTQLKTILAQGNNTIIDFNDATKKATITAISTGNNQQSGGGGISQTTLDPSSPETDTYIAELEGIGIVLTILSKNKINKLINSLLINNKSIWNKIVGLYPFVGTLGDSQAVNAKSPGTFDLLFGSGNSFDSSGLIANGVNSYANTGIIPKTQFIQNQGAVFIDYSSFGQVKPGIELGSIGQQSGSGANRFYIGVEPSLNFAAAFDYAEQDLTISIPTYGSITLNRANSNNYSVYFDGVNTKTYNVNAVFQSTANTEMFIGAINDMGNANYFRSGTYSLVIIAKTGFTDAEVLELSNSAKEYRLGR